MTSLVPHPSHAEDQLYSRTFLTYHVTHRSFQSGAFLGIPIGLAMSALQARKARLPLSRALVMPTLLRSTGIGALVGLALGVPMTFGRMRGREEIEWQDRTWRLLENRGQSEVEGWSWAGALGGVSVAARSPAVMEAGKGRWLRVAGGAGLGNLAGVLGYMVWRYGVKGGAWEDSA